jgi:aminoglycoside phosphotransferase (APT) family kinase protein
MRAATADALRVGRRRMTPDHSLDRIAGRRKDPIDTAPAIDDALVRRLVTAQFPQWRGLSVRPVETPGWDNCTFHLGEHMIVRLPRTAAYATQVEKEARWLPQLAPQLPLQIPTPLAVGQPADGYPWKWSVYRWIDGKTAKPERIRDLNDFATGLAEFLVALQRIDPDGGPRPGAHNFHRGGLLTTYDAETRRAIAALRDRLDTEAAIDVWDSALKTRWNRPPVWLHGDYQRRKPLGTRWPLERYH